MDLFKVICYFLPWDSSPSNHYYWGNMFGICFPSIEQANPSLQVVGFLLFVSFLNVDFLKGDIPGTPKDMGPPLAGKWDP